MSTHAADQFPAKRRFDVDFGRTLRPHQDRYSQLGGKEVENRIDDLIRNIIDRIDDIGVFMERRPELCSAKTRENIKWNDVRYE
jgi:hypothetical protein